MKYVLTNEQKNEIRRKYRENVNTLNRYLPRGQKISTSVRALNRKLNDPNTVKLYVQGNKLRKESEIKVKISQDLYEKYPSEEGKEYHLARVINLFLKPEDTPEAQEYNENVMKAYQKNPKALNQLITQRCLSVNQQNFMSGLLSNDPHGYGFDFYEKNKCFPDFGFSMGTDTLAQKDLNPTLAKYGEAINQNSQIYSDISCKFNTIDEGFLTIPELDEDQINTLTFDIDFQAEPLYESFKKKLKGERDEVAYELSRDIIKNAKKNGLDIQDPDFTLRYVAEKTNEDGTKTYLGMAKFFEKEEDDDSIRLIKLTDEEIAEIKKIYNKDYLEEEPYKDCFKNVKFDENFKNDVLTQYAIYTNKTSDKVDDLNITNVLAENKGGFWERLFNKTSPQFVSFREALNNYEKEKSPFYHNDELLKQRAAAYLNYKGVKSLDDINHLGSTAKQRALLCISAFKGKFEDVEGYDPLNKIMDDKSFKQPAFENEKDLDNDIIKDYEIVEDVKNDLEIEDDQLNK